MLQSREQIGRLDREVTFIKKVTEDGESNEAKILYWEEIANYPTVSARKQEMGGGELAIADRVTYAQPKKFIIRHRTDLTTLMRLVYETRVHEIVSIIEPDEQRGRYLSVTVQLLDTEYFT